MNQSLNDQLREWLKQHPELTPKKPPTIKEQVKEWKQQAREIKEHSKKKKKRDFEQKQGNFESLSESDIKYLMGLYRPTYSRKKGGAFKQR
ncbi:hypothetical protein OEV98_11070 [Caldibacillus lycopersici]|uniref:Uncharacterized protein n=1 Tax=Perspicuibacillus lycopersici TaxID=1325689 RepID=A0AAE3ITC6_9BACI|nr:hypothetical protein [Perspicuibacillus lycopersici]MCU9614101.1 hypothetical protein [Perspicuibacillus lycopersici]